MLDLERRDTICALATPFLSSAIAVIRVSGKNSLDIRTSIFKSKTKKDKPFVATLGYVICPETDDVIDEVLCTFFPLSKSYTGESLFELSIHGSIIIINRILKILIKLNVRLAEPGEFTLRAFLNGKLDLCAAESIGDIINAKSIRASKSAIKSMKGGLSDKLKPIKDLLTSALSEIEVRIDFSEEFFDDFDPAVLMGKMKKSLYLLKKILKESVIGYKLNNSSRVILYGKPNVGKSTLMNSLLEDERSIVHESLGTTRDVLEVDFEIHGLPVNLIDMAGVRDDLSLNDVEVIGIRKAKNEFFKADVILWIEEVTDVSSIEDINAKFNEYINKFSSSIIIPVINKIDLFEVNSKNYNNINFISAKNKRGLNNLKKNIYKALICENINDDEVFLMKKRQINEVENMYSFIEVAMNKLSSNYSYEIVAAELYEASKCLDKLFGVNFNESILNEIFSTFCIGK